MKIVYCVEWSNLKKQPHVILNEEEANDRHINSESYVAVIYEKANLKNVIEIDEKSLTVRFYDSNLENYLFYGFLKKKDRLFLNTVYHYTYKDGQKFEHILFNFKEDGKMYIEKRNFVTNEVEEREGTVDITCNWEKMPEFGCYFDVVREERG